MLSKNRKSHINSLLVMWGEAVAGGLSGMPSMSRMMLSGLSESFGTRELWSANVEEIERAVCALPDDERAVVVELYTAIDATVEQHCRALGMSSSKLYRTRDSAIGRISSMLREWRLLCV